MSSFAFETFQITFTNNSLNHIERRVLFCSQTQIFKELFELNIIILLSNQTLFDENLLSGNGRNIRHDYFVYKGTKSQTKVGSNVLHCLCEKSPAKKETRVHMSFSPMDGNIFILYNFSTICHLRAYPKADNFSLSSSIDFERSIR